MFACMYNNSWTLSEPSNRKLIYSDKSWIRTGYGKYLASNIKISMLYKHLENLNKNIIFELKEYYNILSSISKESKTWAIWFLRTNKLELKRLELDLMLRFLSSENKEIMNLAWISLFKWKTEDPLVIRPDKKKEFLRARIILSKAYSTLKLNISNASSLACHDLLSDFAYIEKIKYCKVLCMDRKNSRIENKKFKEAIEMKRIALLRKRSREIKNLWKTA